jgi:DNA (cytosine-5)-methyltransferase 1
VSVLTRDLRTIYSGGGSAGLTSSELLEIRVARFKVAGLFAGIGGLELGLAQSGHETQLLCEIDETAGSVLRKRFPSVPLVRDIRKLKDLPAGTDLLAGGFPCQDLSQAGETRGITGSRSGLVDEVFRLLRKHDVPHVLLENVSFMLQLNKGQAMRHIADRFEELGYSWAYRVIDSRSFGVPQRRERVYLIASKQTAPQELLFQDDAGVTEDAEFRGKACGFYWTEGSRGLGWAINAIPTLKGGSTIGIPSPPAIWMPDGRIVTPHIRDAERLQGFEAGWTESIESEYRSSLRWKLVGNAVTVGAAAWIGKCLSRRPKKLTRPLRELDVEKSWPRAAFGSRAGGRFGVDVSTWPCAPRRTELSEFLLHESKLLSLKAVSGFLSRLTASSLRSPEEFRAALAAHRDRMRPALALGKSA